MCVTFKQNLLYNKCVLLSPSPPCYLMHCTSVTPSAAHVRVCVCATPGLRRPTAPTKTYLVYPEHSYLTGYHYSLPSLLLCQLPLSALHLYLPITNAAANDTLHTHGNQLCFCSAHGNQILISVVTMSQSAMLLTFLLRTMTTIVAMATTVTMANSVVDAQYPCGSHGGSGCFGDQCHKCQLL